MYGFIRCCDENECKTEKEFKPSADADEEKIRKKRAAAAEEVLVLTECVVCMDASNSHILGPCGHKCLESIYPDHFNNKTTTKQTRGPAPWPVDRH